MPDDDRPDQQAEQQQEQQPGQQPDLLSLYRHAVRTGEAGELVRALCSVLGVSLRGLAEISGLATSTVGKWSRGDRADSRALRDLEPLLKPTKATQRRIDAVRVARRPGRPRTRA